MKRCTSCRGRTRQARLNISSCPLVKLVGPVAQLAGSADPVGLRPARTAVVSAAGFADRSAAAALLMAAAGHSVAAACRAARFGSETERRLALGWQAARSDPDAAVRSAAAHLSVGRFGPSAAWGSAAPNWSAAYPDRCAAFVLAVPGVVAPAAADRRGCWARRVAGAARLRGSVRVVERSGPVGPASDPADAAAHWD